MFFGTVVGNLGGDAVQKQVGESTVVEFSIASTHKVKGEKETTWVRCSYWGNAAEAVAQYLTRGQTVAVSGDLKLREYTTKDGKSGASIEMRVDKLQLCGKREDSARAAPQTSASYHYPF